MTAPGRARAVPGMRWWHKWIGIVIGLLLFGWVASGIIMILPLSSAAKGLGVVEPVIDLATVAISPSQAATAARVEGPIRTIALHQVLGVTVWAVTPANGQPILVHATTAQRFSITPERAKAIAQTSEPDLTPVAVDRIETQPAGYWGRLPAYRVAFNDAAHTEAIVAASTGEVQRSQRRDRIMNSIGHNFHVFGPLTQLPGGQNTRKGSLIMTGLIALLSIISGYWLSLPKRWTRASASASK